jgi:hypothetical protein
MCIRNIYHEHSLSREEMYVIAEAALTVPSVGDWPRTIISKRLPHKK